MIGSDVLGGRRAEFVNEHLGSGHAALGGMPMATAAEMGANALETSNIYYLRSLA